MIQVRVGQIIKNGVKKTKVRKCEEEWLQAERTFTAKQETKETRKEEVNKLENPNCHKKVQAHDIRFLFGAFILKYGQCFFPSLFKSIINVFVFVVVLVCFL